jgi:hypothetical protein
MRNVKLSFLKTAFLSCFVFVFYSLTFAQTTLIDPTGDGGFETGNTFALNGWTAVNTGTTNGSQWFITSSTITNGSYSFVPTTSRAAYISNNAGTNWRYNTSAAAASSHIYKDITFPATQTNINLSFRYNVNGNDTDWDVMYVYLCPQTLTPVANSPSSNTTTVSWTGTGTATLLGTFRNLTAGTGANSGSIVIPAAIAGNTVSSSNMRLVFTWKNDGSGGTEPPAALDDVSLNSATPVPFSGTRTVGPTGNYSSLGAAFADLAANGVNGAVTLELQSTYLSSVETFPVLASAIPGSSGTNTITVRPAAGATGLSITSANTTATLRLSGGSNIIFDGRPGGTGDLAATNLTIANTSTTTGGTAIQFLNDASSNTIQYANLSAAFSSSTSGVLNFLSTTGTTGNDNNTITFNNINGSGTAANGIYAAGNTANAPAHNSGNTISNNNIYDFFVASGTGTNGIQISSGNTGWTISNNRIYQTATRNFLASNTHTGISISNNTGNTSDIFTISGNTIGGTGAALTGGPAPFSPYTLTQSGFASRYRGISISLGSGYTASVQGNTIAGFSFTSNSSATTVGGPWCGIYLNSGIFNIGNVTGNTIGASTGTGSIAITISTNSGSISSGIFVDAASTLNISNNTIGSINTLGSTTSISAGFTGIRIIAATTATVNNNTIGSTSTSSSINAGTASTHTTAQVLTGIRNESSANITISGNTIANFANAYVPTSTTSNLMMGIINSAGVATISQNTIRNLSVGANATGTTISASVIGISMTSTTAGQTVSQNTIHSLSNTNSGANATGVIGIHYNGPTSGTNLVARNQIYGLTTNGTSATGFNYGINVSGGSTTYQNNMITMGNGSSNGIDIRGINDFLGTNNYYFNSIYVGGSPAANTANTFAFISGVTTNTRAFQNNIFVNARTNSGAGKSYAIQVAGTSPNPGGLTINYNDYWVSGTGTVLGRFNAGDVSTIAAWRTAVGQDVNSFNSDPLYAGPTSATPDIKLTTGSPCEGTGLLIASVTDDFEGQSRAGLTPTDVGADAGDYAAVGLDVGVTALVAPASSGCFTATETVTVTLRNNSASLIDFSLNPVTVTVTATGGYSSMLVLNTGTLAGITTQNVNMPATIDLTVNGTYTFNANATVIGDINTGNDAMSPVVRTVLSLGGTKTVGAGGDYTTLTAAVAAYNSASCFTSNVVFNLIDATYSGSETFPISINSNAAVGSNTLTIKPANPGTSISGSSATATILLDGAGRVTIDGSNNGSTSRDLTISNTNIGTTSAVIWGRNGALNNTLKNLIIQGNANTTTLVGAGFGGSTISLSANSSSANNSNTIQNNDIRACQYGIVSNGVSTTIRNTGTVISQNIMNNSGANALGRGGIVVRNDNGVIVSQNLIGNISNGSTIWGISLGNTTTNTYTPGTVDEVVNASITKNIISNINTTGGTSCIGILLAPATSGTSLVANNSISALSGGATPSDFVAGIFVGGGNGSTTNVYHNSVFLSGGGTVGRTAPSIALAIGNNANNPTVNVRNNVLVNTSTSSSAASAATGAYAFSTTSTTYTNLTFNFNCLFVSGTHGVLAGTGTMPSLTARATLTALNTAIGGGTNSIQSDPMFNSTTNLTPLPTSPLENVGDNTTGITDDINGVSRDVTPNLGAYETTGDFNGPTISYTPLINSCLTTSRTLTASITDLSGVPTSGAGLPVLYWRINAGSWTTATGVHAGGSNYDFTFGSSVVATNIVQYYIVAQDNAGVPNVSVFPSAGASGFSINPPAVSIPPSTPNSYTIQPSLSGTYNVGSGGDFTTLTAAVAAYNTSCLSGAVVFQLTSTTYSSGETFPIVINVNSDASAINTLTIRPNTSISSTITGSASNLIRINGADYITIDGSNTGGTDKSLTIQNTRTTDGTVAVAIFSLGAGLGATNNTIKNCIIETGTVGSDLVFSAGIYVGSSGSANGPDNDNLTIQNNTIRKANIGIQVVGGSAVGQQNDNLKIENNTLGDVVNANSIASDGILVGQINSSVINKNIIMNITSNAPLNPTGIFISTGVTNSTFDANNIKDCKYTGTDGYGGKGLDINTGNAASNLTISNNMISNIMGDGWSNLTVDGIVGLRIGGTTGGVKIYNNTVNLGSGIFAGNASGTQSAAFFVAIGVTALDVRNNIFVTNLQNSNAALAKSWSINSAAPITAFTNIDFNDYAVSGTQGILGFIGADRTTLTAIQTGFGQNTNSLNVLPAFLSSTDLHLTIANPSLDNAATPIVGLTKDIDDNDRNTTTPDIGADEFKSCATVTSPDDSGTGTLRAAITCVAENGKVFYDQPTTVTTILTAPLTIDKNVTIQGLSDVARPEITIDPIINVNVGKTLTLQNVDIKSTNPAQTFDGLGNVSITGLTISKP